MVKNKKDQQERTRSQDEQFLIDLDKFENYIVLLREAYAELFTPVQVRLLTHQPHFNLINN